MHGGLAGPGLCRQLEVSLRGPFFSQLSLVLERATYLSEPPLSQQYNGDNIIYPIGLF